MTETNRLMLESYKASVEERNLPVQRRLRALIISTTSDKEVLEQMEAVTPAPAPTGNKGKVITFSPNDFGTKKKRIVSNGVVATFEDIPEETTQPTTEIVEDLTEDKETELYSELAGLSDKLLVERFGSLAGLKSWARDVLGLDIKKNEGKDKALPKIREAIERQING